MEMNLAKNDCVYLYGLTGLGTCLTRRSGLLKTSTVVTIKPIGAFILSLISRNCGMLWKQGECAKNRNLTGLYQIVQALLEDRRDKNVTIVIDVLLDRLTNILSIVAHVYTLASAKSRGRSYYWLTVRTRVAGVHLTGHC